MMRSGARWITSHERPLVGPAGLVCAVSPAAAVPALQAADTLEAHPRAGVEPCLVRARAGARPVAALVIRLRGKWDHHRRCEPRESRPRPASARGSSSRRWTAPRCARRTIRRPRPMGTAGTSSSLRMRRSAQENTVEATAEANPAVRRDRQTSRGGHELPGARGRSPWSRPGLLFRCRPGAACSFMP